MGARNPHLIGTLATWNQNYQNNQLATTNCAVIRWRNRLPSTMWSAVPSLMSIRTRSKHATELPSSKCSCPIGCGLGGVRGEGQGLPWKCVITRDSCVALWSAMTAKEATTSAVECRGRHSASTSDDDHTFASRERRPSRGSPFKRRRAYRGSDHNGQSDLERNGKKMKKVVWKWERLRSARDASRQLPNKRLWFKGNAINWNSMLHCGCSHAALISLHHRRRSVAPI